MTVAPELPPSPVAELHLDASYAPFAGKAELDWKAFFTCNISVKRSFLLRCGRFEPALRWHEDIELGERLRHHGLRVLYNPAALAHHLHYLSERDYLRIAQKEGQALASWYLRRPALEPVLVEIGMRTRRFPRRSWRYALGDLLINRATVALWLRLAAMTSNLDRAASLYIYRAVFQALKRDAIAAALGAARGAA
jgi:hypothetical protein